MLNVKMVLIGKYESKFLSRWPWSISVKGRSVDLSYLNPFFETRKAGKPALKWS